MAMGTPLSATKLEQGEITMYSPHSLVVSLVRCLVIVGLLLSTIGATAVTPVAQAQPKVEAQLVQVAPSLVPPLTLTEVKPASEPSIALGPEEMITGTQEVLPTATPTELPVAEGASPPPSLVRPKLDMKAMGVVEVTGGQLASPDGRVTVEMPAGALKESAVEVSYGLRRSHAVTESERAVSLIEFDLEAARTDGLGQKEAVTHFERPLTLTVSLKGLLDLERVPEGMYVYLYTLTPEGYQNPVWPIDVNRHTGTISAQVDHFSGWGAGIAPGTPGVWEFQYAPPDVALHPGAATMQIPFKVPGGRGGLQPNIGISYDSATLNGLSGGVRGTRDWTRGGEVGGFWSLDGFAKIAREKWDVCVWVQDNGEEHWTTCMQDVFTLILDGTGYELVPAAGGQARGRYYAVGAPDIYIYRNNWCQSYDTNDGECNTHDASQITVNNESKDYWLVRTADGTEIRFGYNADSEQMTGGVCNPHWWGGENCKKSPGGALYGMGYKGEYYPAANNDTNPYRVPRAWWADKWTDQSGNTMEASYYTYWYDNGERVTPKEIKYNSVAGGYLSRVKLEGQAGDGVTPPDNEPLITRVEMYTKGADNNEYLVRKYLFSRQVNNRTKWVGDCASTCGAAGGTCGSGGTCTAGVDYGNIPSYFEVLNSVQEVSGSGASLPAQTFGYEWRSTKGWNDIQQLTSVDNGYGGVTTFTYAGVAGGYCSALGCNDYAVTSRKISAGAGTPDMYTTYDYGAACFDAPWTDCKSRTTILCGNRCNNNSYARLAGFGEATVTSWSNIAMTTALARSKHYFKNANPSYFLGKEYKVETLDPANNNAVLAVQDTTWSGAGNGNVWWAYVADQTATRFSGEIGDSTRTSFVVNEYNNLVSQYSYGAGLRVLNAGFDIDIGGLANWTTYYSGSPVTVTTTGETASFAGRYVLKFSGNNTGGVFQDVSGLVPGATYKARVRVKWSSPSATGTFRLRLHDTIADPNPNNSQSSSMTNPHDGNWKTVEVTYPADWTGAVRLHLDYQVASNEAIYVDEVELARIEDIGDETSTHYGYVHNPDSAEWIIGKNNWKNVYEGITQNGGPGLKFQTLLYYDGATVYNSQTPTQGRLTKMEEGLNSTWRSVQYGYDTYGNTTSITDAEGRVSMAEYDTNQYNYFVTKVARSNTNPEQKRTYVWDKVLGVMMSQTGPDGAVTSYAYDTFGRLKKVAQAPDTLDYPTVEYAYYDGADKPRNCDASGNPVWPLMVATLYRAQAGVAACSGGWGGWERKYMDGLGRVVESQGPGPDWDCTNSTQQGKEVNQYTLYNALGQAVESSVSYYVPQYIGQTITGYILTPYRAPDLSQARSKTIYDTLGAGVRSYSTDGSSGTTLNINRLGVTEGATGQIGLGFTDGRGLVTAADQTMITWPAAATPDDFSDNVLTGWGNSGGSESGGTARIPGTGTDWSRSISRVSAVSDGNGIAFSFESDGSTFAPLLDTGTYGQADYRRWGLLISSSSLTLDTYEGTNHQSSVLLPFKANTWYRAVFKVGGSGEFVVAVWERDNPAASAVRREKRGAAWAGKTWRFWAGSRTGTLQIDDYAELSFKTTRYEYDTAGNLTNVWDVANNNVMQVGYDTYRRRTSMYDKDMGYWSYAYNKVDVLTAQQDPNGNWTCFYTDNLDRVTGVKYMTGATNPCAGQTVYDVTYGYDANGDVGYRTSASNANASTTWSHNERGLVTQESKTVPAYLGRTYITNYTYDSMNRVKSVTYPSGEVVNSNYYAYRPQMSSVSSAAGPSGYGVSYVSNIVYDAQGRVTSQTKGNGLVEAWSYDPLNGKLIQHTAGGLLDMRYGYDPVGNVRAIHDAIRHDGTSETVRYQYDDLERLTGYGTTTLGSVTVRAKGTDSGGLPVMQLRVNGVKVGEWTVTTSYADYTAQVPLSGDDWIDVVYTNDSGARDLYVDYVVVGGVTVQAEDAAKVVYDRGGGLLREALDGLDVIAGQEIMAWPGALRMRVKTSVALAESYTYNDIGNLNATTRTYGGTPVGTCTGTAATLLHAVTAVGSNTFTYDCAGNMLSRKEGSTTYMQEWTPDNKLAKVTVSGGGATEFKYDADGNRVIRMNSDGSRTYYVSGQFEVECPALAQPASLTPANGTVVTPGAGTITWAAVSGASRYLLRLHYSLAAFSQVHKKCTKSANSGAGTDETFLVSLISGSVPLSGPKPLWAYHGMIYHMHLGGTRKLSNSSIVQM
jgi:YD repeat-containing protein